MLNVFGELKVLCQSFNIPVMAVMDLEDEQPSLANRVSIYNMMVMLSTMALGSKDIALSIIMTAQAICDDTKKYGLLNVNQDKPKNEAR